MISREWGSLYNKYYNSKMGVEGYGLYPPLLKYTSFGGVKEFLVAHSGVPIFQMLEKKDLKLQDY